MVATSAPQKYTLREVASLARCSVEALRQQVLAGKLVAERSDVGGRYLVRADEVRRHGWLDDSAGPGHEVVPAVDYERRELMLRARRLVAELGVVMAELGE